MGLGLSIARKSALLSGGDMPGGKGGWAARASPMLLPGPRCPTQVAPGVTLALETEAF